MSNPGNQGQLVITELPYKMDVQPSLKTFGGGKPVVYPNTLAVSEEAEL